MNLDTPNTKSQNNQQPNLLSYQKKITTLINILYLHSVSCCSIIQIIKSFPKCSIPLPRSKPIQITTNQDSRNVILILFKRKYKSDLSVINLSLTQQPKNQTHQDAMIE